MTCHCTGYCILFPECSSPQAKCITLLQIFSVCVCVCVCFLTYRNKLYKGLHGELPDLSVLRVSEVFNNFADADLPMICSMGISEDIPLVDSLFGKVQHGSPLSYQQPAKEKAKAFHDAPPPPSLPLQGYRLEPSECMFVCSRKQQLHMKSLFFMQILSNCQKKFYMMT